MESQKKQKLLSKARIRFAAKEKANRKAKQINPRYDKVFLEGTRRLNEVAHDPQIAFGSPTIMGIKTSNIYDLYLAEDKKIQAVCEWMKLGKREVEAAIAYEQQLINAKEKK